MSKHSVSKHLLCVGNGWSRSWGYRAVQREGPVLKELTAKAGRVWSSLLSDHLSASIAALSHCIGLSSASLSQPWV